MNEKDLALQNPWWERKEAIYEDEKVQKALSRKKKLLYSFKDENILLVGPRQTGKTTFIKLLIKDLIEKDVAPKSILFFSCELLRRREDIVELVKLFDSISGVGKKYLFLDEVTFVEGWEAAIKFILDSPLRRKKTFYITGSSSIGLKKERFPGRPIKIREFLPFGFRSFCELFGSKELKEEISGVNLSPILVFKKSKRLIPFLLEIDRLFYSYLCSGGYPRPFFELIEEKEIKSDTYRIHYDALMYDITKLRRSEKIASSILRGILKNYGTKFSLNSLAKEMEIGSHVTVREYLELFESLYLARNYFQTKPGKVLPILKKARKVFFLDPFVFRIFSKFFGVRVEEKLPTIVEGVVGELLNRRFREVYFYHDRKEVDFILKDVGIEVKWQKNVSEKDFPRIGLKKKFLLSKNDFDFVRKRNLAIVPVPVFLLII